MTLASEHVALVRDVALSVRNKHRSLGIDDLVGYGAIGLMEASRRFDGRAGVDFGAYARLRIRGAMIDGLRLNGQWSRSETLRFKVTGESVRSFVALEDDMAIPADVADPVDGVDLMRMVGAANRAAALLPDRCRELLRRIYVDGQTLLEAGRAMGISKGWACRMRQRAVAFLRDPRGSSAKGPRKIQRKSGQRLTRLQLAALARLCERDQRTHGHARARVYGRLVALKLARYVDYETCSITDAGRSVAFSARGRAGAA